MARDRATVSGILLFGWLLLFAASFHAQENVPAALNFHRWGSITVFNGLPSDSVRSISQTPDGVLWFGTDNGLARFDGRRIQIFTFGDADSNRILALKTSAAGELFVGTQKGAFVYLNNAFQPIAGTEYVGVMTIAAAEEIFLGTDHGTVLQVSRDESGNPRSQPFTSAPIVSIARPIRA